jgi:nitrite reductase (NO-forming)
MGMYEPQGREFTRRHFLAGGAAVSAIAASGVAGYLIAELDGDGRTAAAGTPTPAAGGLAPGPQPQGKVASARDATLPPLGGSPLQLTYRMTDATVEIAAGVMYNSWTYEGTVPGPVLHIKQGDTVQFTLVNDATTGHSMDFHSARTPWDKNYITIVPGESLKFDWTADFPGVFMYHCGTAPVLHHISNGMYGAVVVDPNPPFAPAREYALVQSEFMPARARTTLGWGLR